MAKAYELSIAAHPSIYQPCDRTLNIYYSIPENGINPQTGILLLITGFSMEARTGIYRRMRAKIADAYNLVTVQCNYFGYEFMQDPQSISFGEIIGTLKNFLPEAEFNEVYHDSIFDLPKMVQISSRYNNMHIKGFEQLEETLSNFNDMGIMQALDNITALLAVIKIINQNKYTINLKNVITYGHSHGAYLCFLCNAFAPTLFSLIIDNSAWLLPNYLNDNRAYTFNFDSLTITSFFDYLAKKCPFDEELLNLAKVYRFFKNNCKVISFHGTTDSLISHTEKRAFCESIDLCIYKEISPEQVDSKIFKSTNHGLDADFLELFDYVMQNRFFAPQISDLLELPPVTIRTAMAEYTIDYSQGLPIFSSKTRFTGIISG